MTAFIVPEADAVGRTTTERTDTDLLILSREMNVREKQKRNKTFNSARILDMLYSGPWFRASIYSQPWRAVMDDVGRSDRAEVVADFAASLTQITADATRRVCEQGQTVTHTMSE